MSLRTLPQLPIAARRTVNNRGTLQSETALPETFDSWDPAIKAAAADADNVISILGVIGEDVFGNANNTLRRVSAALRSIGAREIVVHIHSPGGDYFEGVAIYNGLRDHPKKVTVKVLGIAASAASIIAMAGDVIQVPRAGGFMIHNTQAITIGDRHDHQGTVDLLTPFDAAMAEVYAARSKNEVRAVKKMLDEGTWITGQDAIDKGFADAFLPADEVVVDRKVAAEAPQIKAAHFIHAVCARHTDKSRSEIRRIIRILKADMPSAVGDGMPSAAAVNGLSLALGRLQATLT